MNGLALFAGVGGLELGIKQLFPKSRIVCFVEREVYASAVLVSKMEKGEIHEAPIWDDITTFDGSIFSGKVDFITAGFPCQPWSNAGKLQKTQDDRWLWNDIERVICEVRPRFLFLENVAGFLNGGIDPVLRSLASIGFDAEWGCLKVSEVGGNHHRNRIFIFGYLPNSNGFTNHNRRNNSIIQKSIFERSLNIRRSYGNEWKLQSIKQKGIFTNVVNSNGKRLERQRKKPIRIKQKLRYAIDSSWWETESSVCRVVDGLANRVDRLRACGNGVVPYQAYRAFAELISRAIERGNLIES